MNLVPATALVQSRSLLIEDGNHGEYRPRPEEFVESGGTAFIRAADLVGGVIDFEGAGKIDDVALARIRKGVGKPGDVLLSHKGTVGKVARAIDDAPPFVCSPQTTFWRSLDHDAVDPRYLRFALEAPNFVAQLDAMKSESDMAPYVSLTQQRLLKIDLPSPVIQRAIADVLGALDDKIAANTKLATTAHDLSEQLFRAALATDEPRVGRFWDLFTVEFGAPFKGAHFSGEHMGRPLIRIRDLKSHVPQVWTTEERVDEIVVEPGDVIAGMDGDFTPTAWFGERGVLNQRVCRLSSGHSRALTLQAVIEPLSFVEGYKTGTTVAHLNKGDLLEAPARLPSEEASQTFDRRAAHLLDLQVALHAENARLADTRDALLPALMSGRLRVEEAAEVAGL